jgi:hypothetical protein
MFTIDEQLSGLQLKIHEITGDGESRAAYCTQSDNLKQQRNKWKTAKKAKRLHAEKFTPPQFFAPASTTAILSNLECHALMIDYRGTVNGKCLCWFAREAAV